MPAIRPDVLLAVLLLLLPACGEKVSPFGDMTLPSGRVVKVKSYLPENLFTGEEALVLQYIAESPLENAAALDAEVATLWKDLVQLAQSQPGTKLFLVRALPPSASGWDPGHPMQYVYRLQADGKWSMERDPEMRLH